MKTISITLAGAGTVLLLLGIQDVDLSPLTSARLDAIETAAEDRVWTPQTDQELIDEYCVRCHSDRRLRGNLSLETFDASAPHLQGEVAEKMILKLR
ncbi:MAG: hypothetical protein ACPHO4_12260, partial [Longimicrobiales bacterium]